MVNDPTGIVMKYPSSTTKNDIYYFPWLYNRDTVEDRVNDRVTAHHKGTFTTNVISGTNIIGWWEYEPEENNLPARIFIVPSFLSGFNPPATDCETNQSEAHTRGYMRDAREWKNVEMTSWFFVSRVASGGGSIFMEARVGKFGGQIGGCCSDTSYVVEMNWDNSDPTYKGKFQFIKFQNSGAGQQLPMQSQNVLPSFYQRWFGAKFIVFNVPNSNNQRVRLELWLTSIEYEEGPEAARNNAWVKVGEVEDFPGKKWGHGGLECRAPTDDHPITWATPFVMFGWDRTGRIIRFNFTSFREIDPSGSFGQDPDPNENPNPFPNPELPDPDPDPVEPPAPPPIDTNPPQTPQTMVKRFTMRREVVNNTQCRCDGILPTPDPEEPGGGGGTGGGGTTPPTEPGGTFSTIYNVPLSTAGFGRLATVSGNTGYYLRFGQACTRSSSTWLGKTVNRVEITLAKQGTPTGNITCVVRRASNDSVAATLAPTKTAAEISTSGTAVVFENLTNTYQMQLNDKILIEFAGGDSSNFVKVFMVPEVSQSGTKVMFQNNSQDAGEYGDLPDRDMCATIKSLTP